MKCRVCCAPLFEHPIFILEDMPKAAQGLPSSLDIAMREYQGITLKVCQCSSCGLVQLDNELVPYYKDVIRATSVSEEMKFFRLDQFHRFVLENGLWSKKVLEVGCGKGDYLSMMKEAGADAYGIEHCPTSAFCCNDNGLSVQPGYIDKVSYKLNKAPFDAFFIMNFFEHLPDPNTTLECLNRNTTEEAVGIIEVPNFDMMLSNNLFSEFIPDHILYFTEETLRSTVERAGFEVVSCDSIWNDYILSATVKKKKKIEPLDLSEFYKKFYTVKNEIHSYINLFSEGSVSVFGAGHQALTVMAICDLKHRIKYIVDDAVFKQQKFAPSTFLPIVSRKSLHEDPVEGIIIMGASYSDEICKSILVEFPDLSVAILRENGIEVIK